MPMLWLNDVKKIQHNRETKYDMVGNARIILGLIAAVGIALPVLADQPTPAAPQPKAEALKPGLAVRYYFEVYNSIDDLLEMMDRNKGQPGEPIKQLNYRVGPGKVLTSDSSNFVGAHITGLIHLEKAGTYNFLVTSNDGVSVSLGSEIIFEDPDVHADSTSDPISVTIGTPGWYELDVLYFEKKNTSTLILKWKPPDAPGYEVVPPNALKNPGTES